MQKKERLEEESFKMQRILFDDIGHADINLGTLNVCVTNKYLVMI
jgi:hypothetical protein